MIHTSAPPAGGGADGESGSEEMKAHKFVRNFGTIENFGGSEFTILQLIAFVH
jgi:hypothetical protein